MHISLLRHLFYPFKPRRRDVKIKIITTHPFFSRSMSRDFIALLICLRNLVFQFSRCLCDTYFIQSRGISLYFALISFVLNLPNFINSRTPRRQTLNVVGHATLAQIGLRVHKKFLLVAEEIYLGKIVTINAIMNTSTNVCISVFSSMPLLSSQNPGIIIFHL